jgi:CRISPR/Cas system CSM-associated protein Csm3 (group 7 of RAMP superfamily)
MNPYDFVKIDWSKTPIKRAPTQHHKFQGVSGLIEGTITTETPLFIPKARQNTIPNALKLFAVNGNRQAIIPGSSLKGLFRNLVETIGPGCWWLYDGIYQDRTDYSPKLPRAFKQCLSSDQLCPACRMFGLINGRNLLMGHVNFDDAVCLAPVAHSPIFTPILDGPKPRHRAWYLSQDGSSVAGRKFYFHQEAISTSRELRKTKAGVVINQHIQPVGTGSVFTFVANFNNLMADDLSLLFYALTLEPTMRHKIGYAKPAGLGTIRVELNSLTLTDYRTRYTSLERGQSVYEAAALAGYLNEQTAAFRAEQTSVTLQDLRRIWTWPPPSDVAYGYPTRNWFDENSTATIAQTKDAPRQ